MPTKQQPPDELEAFCHSCPEPQEVITFLTQLGLRLDFQMEAFAPPVYSSLAELPAQFHFADESGMSLIYLAGEDSATEDGERLPVHKSRFWSYAGADAERFERITQSWPCGGHSPGTVHCKHSRMSPREKESTADMGRSSRWTFLQTLDAFTSQASSLIQSLWNVYG